MLLTTNQRGAQRLAMHPSGNGQSQALSLHCPEHKNNSLLKAYLVLRVGDMSGTCLLSLHTRLNSWQHTVEEHGFLCLPHLNYSQLKLDDILWENSFLFCFVFKRFKLFQNYCQIWVNSPNSYVLKKLFKTIFIELMEKVFFHPVAGYSRYSFRMWGIQVYFFLFPERI